MNSYLASFVGWSQKSNTNNNNNNNNNQNNQNISENINFFQEKTSSQQNHTFNIIKEEQIDQYKQSIENNQCNNDSIELETKFNTEEYNSQIKYTSVRLAKGLSKFFSKKKQDILKEIELLQDDEELKDWKIVLTYFYHINNLTEIKQRIDDLWILMNHENLEFPEVLVIKESISHHINHLDSFEDKNTLEQISLLFHQLIEVIQPLDIELMISYIQKSQRAIHNIQGKDIILLLGETGAGKSTTIHFLAGSKFQEIFVDGFDHLEPFQVSNFLDELKVGASTQSVTTSIIAIQFPDGFIICDTPGFGDTKGTEIDISNGIGIIKALCSARSIKPIMVLSEKNMDRLIGIRKINKTLSSMFKDIKAILPSMIYIFTKYQPKYTTRIYQQVTRLKEEFNENDKLDTNYITLVEDIIQKTTPKAIIIDPLQSSNDSISKDEILNIIQNTPSCYNPSEILQTFVSSDSSKKLTDQWLVLQRQIHLAFQSNNIESLFKPFNDMKILSQLELESYQPILNDAVKMLEKYTNNLYTLSCELFTSCFNSKTHLDENKMNNILISFRKVVSLDSILVLFSSNFDFSTLVKQFISESISKYSMIYNYTDDLILIQLNTVHQVISLIGKIFFIHIDDNNIIPHPDLSNSDITQQYYFDLTNQFNDLIKCFRETIIEVYSNIKEMIQNFHQPNDLLVQFHKFQLGKKIILIYSPETLINEEFDDISFFFQNNLEKHFNICSNMLIPQLNVPFSENIQKVSRFCQYLIEIKNTPQLNQYLAECDIYVNLKSSKLLELIETSLKILVKLSHNLIQDNKFEDLNYYLSFIQNSQKNISLFSELFYNASNKITIDLQEYLINVMNKFNIEIINLSDINRNIQNLIEFLKSCLFCLYQSQFIFPQFNYLFDSIVELQNIIEKKIHFIQNHSENNFKLFDIEKLLSNLKFSHQITQIISEVNLNMIQNNPSNKKISEISNKFDEVLKLLSSLDEQTLNLISKIFYESSIKLSQLSFSEYKEMAIFVITIHQFQIIMNIKYPLLNNIIIEMPNQSLQYFEGVNNNLINYFDFIQKYWNPNESRIIQLSNEQFNLNVINLKDKLFELTEFVRYTEEYQTNLSYELLFDPPRKIMNKWINIKNSYLSSHISLISRYLNQINEMNNIAPDFINNIFQIIFITRKMSCLDVFYKNSNLNYSTLYNLSDNIIKKINSNISNVKSNLQMKKYKIVKETLERIKNSSIPEVQDSFIKAKKEIQNYIQRNCNSINNKIESKSNLTFVLFPQILQQGDVLKSISITLEEFINHQTLNQINDTLRNFESYIESILNSILIKANSRINISNFDICLQSLLKYEEFFRIITESTSTLSLNLEQHQIKSKNIQKNMINLLNNEVNNYQTKYHPVEYLKHSPKSLFEKLKSFSNVNSEVEILSSNLNNYIITKLTNMLTNINNNVDKDFYHSEVELSYITNCLDYLTEEILNSINELYQISCQQINKYKEKNQQEIENGKDIENLISLYDKYCQKNQFTNIRIIREYIYHNIEIECIKFRNDVMIQHDTITLLKNYPISYTSWKKYLDLVNYHYNRIKSNQSWTQYVSSSLWESHEGIECINDIKTESLILRLIDEILDYLQLEFQKISLINSPNDGSLNFLKDLEEPWEIISNLILINNSNEEHYKKFIRFLERRMSHFKPLQLISSFQNTLRNYFIKVSQNYGEILRTKNLKAIKEFVEKLKIYDNLVNSIKRINNGLSENNLFLNYSEATNILSQELYKLRDSLKQSFLGNPATVTINSTDKERFYSEIYSNFCVFKNIELISSHVNQKIFKLSQRVTGIERHISTELKKIETVLENLIEDFPTNRLELYDQFSMCLDNLRSFSKEFCDGKLCAESNNILRNIENKFQEILDNMKDTLIKSLNSNDLNQLIDKLIELKQIGCQIFSLSSKINNIIDISLNKFVKINANQVAVLSINLSQVDNPVAKRLLQEHKAFEDYQILARNQKILKFSIHDLLGTYEIINSTTQKVIIQIDSRLKHTLRGTNITDESKIYMNNLYKQFDNKYWTNVEQGYSIFDKQDQDNYLNYLVHKAFIVSNDKTISIFEIYQELATLVFAYWTLSKWYSSNSRRQNEILNIENYQELIQPHSAQIIAIYRLLGIDCNSMEHHLTQISTGEGKSVTLAGVSIILALTGNSIDCVCYSEYLSQRDYHDFQFLFKAFKVENYIKYQTFNDLCESVINRNGDLREFVHDLILPQKLESSLSLSSSTQSNIQNHFNFNQQEEEEEQKEQKEQKEEQEQNYRSHILLIDEVDVFLNEDFYGNFYHPIVKVSHPTISNLIDYVWINRTNVRNLKFRNISTTNQYNTLILTFPKWKNLFDELIKALCSDVIKYSSHEYIIKDGKVGYKDQDTISFTLTFGFQTMFVYYELYEKNEINLISLEKQKYFPIDCGTFAFSEIPKLYNYILGVSGTLETLSDKENDLLTRVYQIQKQTIIPSVYGPNQLSFHYQSDDDFKIESRQSYHIAIVNEIRRRLVGSMNTGYNRAVLVFFESISRLEEFYNFAQMSIRGMAKITEKTSQIEKEGNISSAVSSGRVTLLTKAFGRGTDFICYDDQLQLNGGIHVIQTFFSSNKSEEVQIKGRTARQGNKGSYSLVMLDEDLERVGINEDLIREMKGTKNYYEILNRQREIYFEKQYLQDIQHVEEIKQDHQKSLSFVSNLMKIKTKRKKKIKKIDNQDEDEDEKYLIEFLENRNIYLGGEIDGNGSNRTICLLDATSSMTNCLRNAKQSVSKMFERAYEILKEHGIESSFEMQFVAYRNYNAPPEYLLQYSPWSSRPIELQQFLGTIEASYGWKNEAIEIGLHHVNQQHQYYPVGQVVLIGDMPPNTDEEVRKKRTERNWNGTLFETPTYFHREFDQILSNKIKVHAFYVDNKAKECFDYISRESGGESSYLNVDDLSASEELTRFVTCHILNQQVGGGRKGAELIATYDTKYGRKGHIYNNFESNKEIKKRKREETNLV